MVALPAPTVLAACRAAASLALSVSVLLCIFPRTSTAATATSTGTTAGGRPYTSTSLAGRRLDRRSALEPSLREIRQLRGGRHRDTGACWVVSAGLALRRTHREHCMRHREVDHVQRRCGTSLSMKVKTRGKRGGGGGGGGASSVAAVRRAKAKSARYIEIGDLDSDSWR